MTVPTPLIPPPPRAAPAGVRVPTRRNAELVMILFAMVIVGFYTATMELALVGHLPADFFVLPVLLTLVFVGAHIMVRILTPYADPAILPCVALLNGLGVMFLRRLDLGDAKAAVRGSLTNFGGLAFHQLTWTVIAVVVATVAMLIVRDHRSLSRYAYTLGLLGIVLMMMPAVLPASMSEVNGAKLWIKVGGFQIQPGEFAKLLLLCLISYYLVRKREVLSLASRRVLGIDFPRGRDLGPVLVVWLLSLMVLIFEKDLGTSLLYFGLFVVTLYIATERVSWLIIGLLLFFGGSTLAYFLGASVGGPFANFYLRVTIWLDPFADPSNKGYQLVQSLLGLGTGGIFGSGPGAGNPSLVPFVENDFIFAGMGEEIGLFGLTALLLLYLAIVERGLRAALAVRDSFGKLVAGGLSFTLGLQIFVMVGGVTGLIPLTGQTTPFLSAGGSSLMANWLLVVLLLRISDAARRPVTVGPAKAPPRLAGLATEVVR